MFKIKLYVWLKNDIKKVQVLCVIDCVYVYGSDGACVRMKTKTQDCE